MIRLSLVDYLNSAPLGWSFLRGPLKGRVTVVPAVPSKCADQLSSGEVDAGLIPAIEYQRIPDLEVVPGIGIASTRSVRSVLLVSRRGARIRRVALDTSSRTSVALVRILLQLRMKLDPEYVPQSPDLQRMLDDCDAALIIGDAALRVPLDEYDVVDLAEAWIDWQGLPFVFAFWACRLPREESSGLAAMLHEAKEWGVSRRCEIAAVWAGRIGLPEAFLLDYLQRNIDYDLSEAHVRGLEKFYALAAQTGLLADVRPVRFTPRGRLSDAAVCP
jgi:chorismate dehydratase